MKNQALFSLKDKSKKSKCCQLQILFGTLRVKYELYLLLGVVLSCPPNNSQNSLLELQ